MIVKGGRSCKPRLTAQVELVVALAMGRRVDEGRTAHAIEDVNYSGIEMSFERANEDQEEDKDGFLVMVFGLVRMFGCGCF